MLLPQLQIHLMTLWIFPNGVLQEKYVLVFYSKTVAKYFFYSMNFYIFIPANLNQVQVAQIAT